MSDPQDLLYTNNFIETNTLSKQQIEQDTQYYDRYINFLDNNPNNQVQEYLDTNLYESDEVNIQQTNNKPWPIDLKKNRYPLMDNLSKDISVNRYTQEQVLNLTVNSDERDTNYFPYTTEFQVTLPAPLNNVKSIELTEICLPSYNDNITNMNNNFAWQFFTNYFTNNINSFNIIPYCDINRKISYYSLPYSTYKIDINKYGINYNPELYLTYQINIPSGHYEINLLLNNIKILTKNVLHGSFDINTISLFQNTSKSRIPDMELPPIMEEPYNSFPYLQYSSNLWNFEINLNNDAFFAVNRMEELNIVSYQTFIQPKDPYTDSEWQDLDIFYNYSDNPGNLDPKYIYITVPYQKDVTNFWYEESANNPFFPSAFPLVLTGLATVDDNLNTFMRNLNMTPFFDLNIYIKNTQPIGQNPIIYTEDELFNICYYKYNDTITIPTNSTIGSNSIILTRFALRYSSAGLKGQKFNNSTINVTPKFAYVKPSQTISILYSSNINAILLNKTNKINYTIDVLPLIGRSLLCRFIFDQDNGIFVNYENDGDYEKKRTFLNLLGYSIGNQTSAFLVSSYNNGFSFVHSNRYTKILDLNIPELYYNILPSTFDLISPQTKIQFSIENGLYYLSYKPFVYIQMLFVSNSSNSVIQQFNIQSSQDGYSLSINENYSNSFITAILPLGLPLNCVQETLKIQQKDKSNIIAKILTSTLPGNLNTLNNNINSKPIIQSFNQILNDIKTIQINILDSSYRIIQSNKNYSMLIKFVYDVHKLKETNINTKTNNVDIIGNIK
jgi:hypothetical protein